MARKLLVGLAVVASLVMTPAYAEGPPYDDDPTGLCSGTFDRSASADRNTGAMSAAVTAGSTADIWPVPGTRCSTANIRKNRRDLVPGQSYRVTVTLDAPTTGPTAPRATTGPAELNPSGTLARSRVFVELVSFAMDCSDPDGCGGSGQIMETELACAPVRAECANPGRLVLEQDVWVPNHPTGFISVSVTLRADAQRLAPPFRADASGSVVVSDITLTAI